MRYVTIVVRPAGAYFHPVHRRLVEDPDVHREAIHSVRQIDDGTIALLGEVRGDLDRYREILADSPEVVTYAVSGDREGMGYSQIETNAVNDALLARHDAADYVVKMPIECLPDGSQRMTLVGDEAAFATSPPDPPEGVEIEVESTGQYHPDLEDVFARLTERQRDVLEAALELGYYENPREATQADVAERVGISPGTAGEHLRLVESKVFGAYVP